MNTILILVVGLMLTVMIGTGLFFILVILPNRKQIAVSQKGPYKSPVMQDGGCVGNCSGGNSRSHVTHSRDYGIVGRMADKPEEQPYQVELPAWWKVKIK